MCISNLFFEVHTIGSLETAESSPIGPEYANQGPCRLSPGRSISVTSRISHLSEYICLQTTKEMVSREIAMIVQMLPANLPQDSNKFVSICSNISFRRRHLNVYGQSAALELEDIL